MIRILVLFCSVSIVFGEDVELIGRRDHLKNGEITTTGRIRNVSTHSIFRPKVFVGFYTDEGQLVRYRTDSVKIWRVFPVRHLDPGETAGFRIRTKYDPTMTMTRIRFHTSRGVPITHRRIR